MQIHETADVEAAQQFWPEITGAPPVQFTKPALKRHNPKTNRKNVGDGYHGCLRISVHRGSALYRKIEGWASAAMATDLRTPTRLGVEPTLCSRGRIRTFVLGTKTLSPAWLDDPGSHP